MACILVLIISIGEMQVMEIATNKTLKMSTRDKVGTQRKKLWATYTIDKPGFQAPPLHYLFMSELKNGDHGYLKINYSSISEYNWMEESKNTQNILLDVFVRSICKKKHPFIPWNHVEK